MTTAAARADVLTAEVRILEVSGARLTPAMLAQLDETAWDDTDVLGASARAWDRGALVRSVLPVPALAAALADGGPPPGPEAAEWRGYLLGLDAGGRDAVVAACQDWAELPLILLDIPGGPA
jgi:hypothetical protein